MLKQEHNYQFKERLLTIHPKDIRDFTLTKNPDDYEIKNGVILSLPKDSSDVILTASKDFLDYLLTSMNISAMISKEEKQLTENAVVITLCENQSEDYVITFGDVITVTAKTDRSAAQALYCLEDMMNTRKAPFIKKEKISHTFLFSPRMVHPGYGVDEFPSEHLAQIAHAGMDAVLIFVKGVNETPSGYYDFNELCYRAAKYGIDVYAYSYLSCTKHPDEEGAQATYDAIYGEIFKNCPNFKGLVLVGESIYFNTRDKNAHLRSIYGQTVEIPSDAPHPGFWPCSDYPRWLEVVKNSVYKYKNDADIVFWTYNWGFAPEENRIELINNLPKDVSLLVTYEMYETVPREGITEICSDYTLSFAGPGNYFKTEAEAAKKNGLRLYAMANTGGQTWDFGLAPYEPMPYQWIKRYEGLREAHEKWGLSGLMESHHFGFFPSFIGDLSKKAFIAEKDDLSESLKEVVFARFGTKNFDIINEALKKWSEAITYYTPSDDDQYGPFRVGPSFPFSLIRLRKPPSNKYAHFGNRILKNCFPAGHDLASPPPTGRGVISSLRAESETVSLEKMYALMKEGVDILEEIPESDRISELCYLINLGKYLCCYVMTGVNAKKWYRLRNKLLCEENIDNFPELIKKARELLLAERENATEAIEYVMIDTRLGWEPSMDYLGDEKAIKWKIEFLDYVHDIELKYFEKSSDKKWITK